MLRVQLSPSSSSIVLFFFSSRRRHTRFDCDWSSDVCSSDLPYSAIPGFPEPGAPGHKGELVGGTLEGVPVVVQSGRFHLYEGPAPDVAALPTRVFARLGATPLVVTNAAGGIRLTFRPPTLMLIADHINLMFKNPLVGPVAEGDERFPDMSDPYDPALMSGRS